MVDIQILNRIIWVNKISGTVNSEEKLMMSIDSNFFFFKKKKKNAVKQLLKYLQQT